MAVQGLGDGAGRRRAALLLVAVVSVNASYTVLIPFVPDLQERAGAGPTVVALTFALFAATKALAQPVGGFFVDRWRPGGVACVALIVAAAGIALTAVARDPTALLAGRVCWGLGEGLVTPALYAGMAELCRRHGMPTSRMTGYFGSAAVSGFLLGPLVAGVAAPVGLEALFLAGAAATVLTAFGVLAALPAATPAPADDPAQDPAQDPARDTGTGTSAASATGAGSWWVWVLALGALDMVTNLSYSALEPVLPIHLSGSGASARGTISVVFVVGLATFGVCSWLLGRLAERLRLVTLVKIGLAFSAVGLAGLATSASVVPVAAWFVLVMVGQATLYVTARRGVAELRSAATRRGAAFGLFGLASDVGNVIGPLVGVALYAWSGRVTFVLLGALSGLLLAGLVAAARRPRPPRPPAPLSRHVRTATLFDHDRPLELASGATLAPVTVAYETYGVLDDDRSNAIVVCHALTGDSHPAAHDPDDLAGWWEHLVGPGRPVDTERYFVVCANVLGGCAGTTGPWSVGPGFPPVEVGDLVTVQRALLAHLGIARPRAVVGGSLGGMQVLEWLLRAPDDAADFLIIAATARPSADNLAWNAVARAAIRSDPRFRDGRYRAGAGPAAGLGLARMIGHLTYLSEEQLKRKFGRTPRVPAGRGSPVTTGPFAVEGYLEHQAAKLVGRFDANSYLHLTSAMDRFDAFAGDRTVASPARAPGVHLFSFASDRLYGPAHSRHIQAGLARLGITAHHHEDDTTVAGHDAFLLEVPTFLRRVSAVLDREPARGTELAA